jgi:hypothetical protein
MPPTTVQTVRTNVVVLFFNAMSARFMVAIPLPSLLGATDSHSFAEVLHTRRGDEIA